MVNDVQLLRTTIDNAIDENSTIRNIQNDATEMKSDIIILKNHASAQSQRLDRLSGNFDRLSGTVDQLSESHHRLGLRMESMQGELRLILDAVLPAKQRAEQIDRVEA